MSGDQEGCIGNCYFYRKIDGFKAVILFPALTTPALVDDSGCLDIILAVHKDAMVPITEVEGGTPQPGKKLDRELARKFHAQLLLTSWGNGHPGKVRPDGSATSYYNGQNHWGNTLYKSCDGAGAAYDAEKYKPWYVASLEGKKGNRFPVYVEKKDGKRLLGILAEAAVDLCIDQGYEHLFHLDFSELPKAAEAAMDNGELFELIWLFRPRVSERDDDHYTNCTDMLVVKNFSESLNEGLLEPNIGTKPQTVIVDAEEQGTNKHSLKLESMDLFRLLQDSKEPYMSQKGGNLLFPFHPVYFKADIESAGLMADLHLSSRQVAYTWVDIQVIPGVEHQYSPNLGLISHQNLVSSKKLAKEVSKADVICVAGDIYDHMVNLVPKEAKSKVNKNVVSLWNILDFRVSKKQSLYRPHIDGLMMMQLILDCYNESKKPIFFVTGNHEAYQDPYGISPRVNMLGKVNEGIPADHNLSIYEAVLMFGPSFGSLEHKWNFKKENLRWIYQTFTPWTDYIVHHKSLSLTGIGWGDDEEFIKPLLRGGGILPRATTSLDAEQKKLVLELTKGRGKCKLLLTHFPFTSFAPEKAFGVQYADRFVEPDPRGYVRELSKYDFGSAIKERDSVLMMLASGKFDYILSGHAHRGGIYTAGAHPLVPEPGMMLETHIAPKGSAIITGSTGTMSVQNIRDEFHGLGMDKPQAMTLNLDSGETVFYRYSEARPRLAVVLAYLKDSKQVRPFFRLPVVNKHWAPRSGMRSIVGQPGDIFFYSGILMDRDELIKKSRSTSGLPELVAPHRTTENGDWLALGAVPENFYSVFGGTPVDKVTFFKEDDEKYAASLLLAIQFLDLVDYPPFTSGCKLQIGSVKFDGDVKEIEQAIYGYVSLCFVTRDCQNANVRGLLNKYYDVSSPWCMPASLVPGDGGYWLKFDWSELPSERVVQKYKNLSR